MPAVRIKASPDELDSWLGKQGYRAIAGTDEAGRGALAGPIVGAAVVLGDLDRFSEIRDSKTLTPKQRNVWYAIIESKASVTGVGLVSAADIDRYGIQKANMFALENAVAALAETPDCVLADWYDNPTFHLPWHAVVNGESTHPAIAAASIIAKVTRDRIMVALDEEFPEYGLAGHKGYGSAAHLQALKRHGPSPAHRLSFAPCCPRPIVY